MPGFLQGNEILILLIIVVLLVLGPTKLPQLARGFGQALREFRRAAQGLTEEEEAAVKSMSKKEEVDPELVKRIAEKLGVTTEGKSEDELIREIVAKAKERKLI